MNHYRLNNIGRQSQSSFHNHNTYPYSIVSKETALQATKVVLVTKSAPSIVSQLATALLCFSKFVLNPAISGGVLSGALHAVTGTFSLILLLL